MINNSNSDSNLTSDTQHDTEIFKGEISQEEKLRLLAEKGISFPQNSLSTDEFCKLTDLLFRNIDLFATSMHDLVGTKVELMHIDTGDVKLVRQRPYRQTV